MGLRKSKKDVYKIITDKVIAAIEDREELIWQKSWNTSGIRPQNYISKKPYRGFNRIVTMMFPTPYFLTFNQVRSLNLNAKVTKGKSIPIIYWNMSYKDDNNKDVSPELATKSYGFLKYSNVWNSQDIEGIDFEMPETVVDRVNEPIKECQKIINKNSPDLTHGGDRAYYMPSADKIQMPEINRFKSSEHYYSTLFHELVHWTGNENRLKRDLKMGRFGDTVYSKEELVAEMGAAFLCDEVGIFNSQIETNSVAYIRGWLTKLKSNPRYLVKAGGDAQKAFDLIMGES